MNQKEFLKGIEDGIIYCDCFSLNDSRHKITDYLYIFLNNVNLPYYNEIDEDNYFSELSPTKIINLFFTSIELFESIYTNFFTEYNEFVENLNMKSDRINIGPYLSNGYSNFCSNADNCKDNFYFNEKIAMLFSTDLTKNILDKNFKISNEQKTKFIIDYLRGYSKFRLGSYMNQMPKYLITDIFNLTPFQRYLWFKKCQTLFYSNGLKSNLIKTVVNSIENIIRQRPDLEKSIQIIIELLRIIKFYARFNF